MSLLWMTILACAAMILVVWGGALLSLLGRKLRLPGRLVTSFAAGIFLTVAVLHMIPESFELLGEAAGLLILGGYVLIHILERFVMVHACEEGDCVYHHVGLPAFVGLSIHSFLNGVALGSALLVPGLALGVFLGSFFHKLPESFSLSSLLWGGIHRRLWVMHIAGFSLMVPLGTVLAVAGLAPGGGPWIGAALAVSAGTFLQISTGDLLARTHREGHSRYGELGGFLLGVGLVTGGSFWLH